MNRTQLIGLILFVSWVIGILIFIYPLLEVLNFIVFHFIEFWKSTLELDFINVIDNFIHFIIGAVIIIPIYMIGISCVLLILDGED